MAVMGFRLIDDIIAQEERKKQELQRVNTQLGQQLYTIGGLSNAHFAVYWVDLQTDECKPVKNIPFFEQAVRHCETIDDVVTAFNTLCVQPEDREKMRGFTDWRILRERLKETDVVVEEFHGAISPWGWCRASWIAAARDEKGEATSALFTVEEISASIADRKQREQEHKLLEEQNRVISGLSKDYDNVWLITDNGQTSTNYRSTDNSVLFTGEKQNYTEGVLEYVKKYVCEEDREDFACKTRYEVVSQQIHEMPLYSVVYKRQFRDEKKYYQVSFTLTGSEDSNDFVMGFKDVNDVVLAEH